MNRPRRAGEWPRRLADETSNRFDPPFALELSDDLRAGLRDCSDVSDAPERIARGAARKVLAQLDARRSFEPASLLAWARSLFRPRVLLAALGLALVLRLGGALAEELGPRPLVRVADWVERQVDSLGRSQHRRGPAPTILAPSEAQAPSEALLPHDSNAGADSLGLFEAGAATQSEVGTPGVSPQAIGTLERQESRARSRRRTSVSAAPDTLESEAAVVSRAVALAGTDSRGALGLLSGYWRDYPNGALRGEAAVAEVSALQASGKTGEALARLDGWSHDGFRGMGQAGSELSLTRLELMVGAGRCSEALPLLERELSANDAPRRLGRALLAHAACKGKLGDSAGNRAALERYLRELPDGPRAAQVRHALGIGD